MSKETAASPEKIAAVKEVIETETYIKFNQLLEAYQSDPSFMEFRDGRPLTEVDLINDILECGREQLDEGAAFEEVVTQGAYLMASILEVA